MKLLILAATLAVASAQTPPSFEVASIKVSEPGTPLAIRRSGHRVVDHQLLAAISDLVGVRPAYRPDLRKTGLARLGPLRHRCRRAGRPAAEPPGPDAGAAGGAFPSCRPPGIARAAFIRARSGQGRSEVHPLERLPKFSRQTPPVQRAGAGSAFRHTSLCRDARESPLRTAQIDRSGPHRPGGRLRFQAGMAARRACRRPPSAPSLFTADPGAARASARSAQGPGPGAGHRPSRELADRELGVLRAAPLIQRRKTPRISSAFLSCATLPRPV